MPPPESPRWSVAGFSAASRSHTQPQYARSKSSTLVTPTTRLAAPPPREVKTRSGHAQDAHGHRACSQRKTRAPEQFSSIRRERTAHIARASWTESPAHSHSSGPAPSDHQRAFPALRAKDILRNPRLQQVTGLLPRKAELWADRSVSLESFVSPLS